MITEDIGTFRDALPERGRLLSLDLGAKTIGLATADSRWTVATPLATLPRGKFSADLQKLLDLHMRESIAGWVVGLPRNMDGSDSPQTQSVRAFVRNVARGLDCPILLWDERWSTQAVNRTLIAADASRARRADVVDKLAAAYILQGAIDALTRPRL